MKLTKEQIESLAHGLPSKKNNYKLTKKNIHVSNYERNYNSPVYLETRNFKIEEINANKKATQ